MARRPNWERVRIETRDSKQPRKYKPLKHHRKPPKPARSMPPAPAPTCPLCNFPMARRNGPSGPFWGCHQFPRCKGTRE